MQPLPLVPTERPIDVLCGTWKRCLTTRVFGTFSLARDQNTIVHIEATGGSDLLGGPLTFPGSIARPAPVAQPYRLRWSFGRTPDSLRAGYTVEPLMEAAAPQPHVAMPGAMAGNAASRVIPLKVAYAGNDCLGTYQPDLGLMMVHLVAQPSTATVIYRAIDEDTLAVSITEVPASTGPSGTARRGEPTIQYGYMFRLPPASS